MSHHGHGLQQKGEEMIVFMHNGSLIYCGPIFASSQLGCVIFTRCDKLCYGGDSHLPFSQLGCETSYRCGHHWSGGYSLKQNKSYLWCEFCYSCGQFWFIISGGTV